MNHTFIDDSDPNIIFSSGWTTGLGTYEFNRTAHGTTTTGSTVIYTFKGTSISAYGTIGVLPNNVTTPSNGTWSIDGSSPTFFQVEVTNTNLYRQLYFQSPDIPDNGDHTLTLTFNTNSNVIVWFDYFMVTPSTQVSYGDDRLVKVDDTDPSVQYTGTWNEQGSPSDFNNTVHVAGSSSSKVNFSFYGTAISVFGILPNLTETPSQPSASFTLDNGTPISFSTIPPDQPGTIHQVPIFQSFNLTLDHHQLEIESHDNNATLQLDFFMYEQPANATSTATTTSILPTGSTASTSSPSSHVNSGAIAGGVVGGVLGVLFVAALLFWLWRRGRTRPDKQLDNFSPFIMAEQGSGSLIPTVATGYAPVPQRYSSPLSNVPTTTLSTSRLSQSEGYLPVRKEPIRSPPPQSLTTGTRLSSDASRSQVDDDAQPPPYHAGGS